MGKYPPSKLRAAFSEWHYKKLNSHSFGIDIDFIETKKENGMFVPIGILEISRPGNKLTEQEMDIYQWLISKTKLPVYVIYTTEAFDKFGVWFFPTDIRVEFSEKSFIRWLDNLRGYKSNFKGADVELDSIKKQLNTVNVSNSIQTEIPILG